MRCYHYFLLDCEFWNRIFWCFKSDIFRMSVFPHNLRTYEKYIKMKYLSKWNEEFLLISNSLPISYLSVYFLPPCMIYCYVCIALHCCAWNLVDLTLLNTLNMNSNKNEYPAMTFFLCDTPFIFMRYSNITIHSICKIND